MSDTVTEKKPRKVNPKAPNRAKEPVAFQVFQLNRAIAILAKVDKQTTGWPAKIGSQANDAIDYAKGAITSAENDLPADFKAPRAKGHGGGRTATRFVIGMDVTLAETAMARVVQLFPDVTANHKFRIATNAKESDKLLPIVCTGIDGNSAPFFVDRAKRSELKPVNAA